MMSYGPASHSSMLPASAVLSAARHKTFCSVTVGGVRSAATMRSSCRPLWATAHDHAASVPALSSSVLETPMGHWQTWPRPKEPPFAKPV